MARPKFELLRRFVLDALHEWQIEKKRFEDQFPNVAPRIGTGWPYAPMQEDSAAPVVLTEMGTEEDSRKELIWRLKQVQYPWSRGEVTGKTIYEHIDKQGLLEVLLTQPLLFWIRQTWLVLGCYAVSRQRYDVQKSLQKSQRGNPQWFHRDMAAELLRHINQLDKIAGSYGVQDESFKNYRRSVLKALLTEVTIYYPHFYGEEILGKRWTPATEMRQIREDIGAQIFLFDQLETSFAEKKVKNNTLCYQISALICSSTPHIKAGELYPTPASIRENVRNYRAKHP